MKSKASSIESQINIALRRNIDGSITQSTFNAIMPTVMYLQTNSVFKEMFIGFNVLVIVFLFLLASIVIYSLMISDVNE